MGRHLTFSVGIPAYNQGEFLEKTIVSLLNQTRPPDEIVVSDHYSTDSTPEIIEKYSKHIRAVKPPPGVNLTGQYNFTLQSQTCDWITLLSSDDVAQPNFCEVLMRGAARSNDAVLVRAGWENIDADGKVVGQNYLLSVPGVEGPPTNLTSQKHGPKVNFAAFAIRREAYLKSGPILGSIESLADWALFLQLAPFGSFIYEPVLLGRYRVGHDGNKFLDRLGPWCRDQQRIFEQVIPLAAERAGIRDTAWIAEASRYNFLRYLSAASDAFAPAERPSILGFFEEWASKNGEQDALEAFAAGRTVRTPMPLWSRVRRALHPYVHGLYSQLRVHK